MSTPEQRQRELDRMRAWDGRERRIAAEAAHSPSGSVPIEDICDAVVWWEGKTEDAFGRWEQARLVMAEARLAAGDYPSDVEHAEIADAEAAWKAAEQEYLRCKAQRDVYQGRLDAQHDAVRGIW